MKQYIATMVILLGAGLCGCAADAFDPVQLGHDKYKIGGDNETSNATKAQQFCRGKGFDYAEVTWTDRGLTRFDADKTEFFCMHNGEHLTGSSGPPPMSFTCDPDGFGGVDCDN